MARLNPLSCALLVAFLLSGSVSSGDPATRADISSTSPSPTFETSPQIATETDTTLSLEQYIELGFPAADRTWSGADMHQAAQLLIALERRQPGSLPRSKSPQSGALFARLTARENLTCYRNRSIPINARVPDMLEYLEGSSLILKLYLHDLVTQNRGQAELAQLLCAQLYLAAVTVETMDEYLASLDANSSHQEEREKGIRQMKDGLASIVAGSIQTLTESHVYETTDLKQLALCMSDTFPTLLPAIPEGARSEAVNRISRLSKDPEMQYLQPELDQLLNRLETPSVAFEGNGILQLRRR